MPWLGVLDRQTSVGGAVLAGLGMALAFVLAVFGWFAGAIQAYTGAPFPVALLVLAVLVPMLEPQFVIFAVARHLARVRGGFWRPALIGASIYVGTEWLAPKLFTDTLGHGLYASTWMRQAADLGGPSGLTFLLIVANECVRRAVARRTPAPAGVAALLAVALLAYGGWRVHRFDAAPGDVRPVNAGIVQADLSHYDRLAAEVGTFEAVRRILDAHYTLTEELLGRARVDVVLWPETVYPTTFGSPKSPDGAAFDREIAAFVARTGVPLVFGAYDRDGGGEFNAAVFLGPPREGRASFASYRKASLFPLTERVPPLLESPRVRRWLPWLGTWKAGPGGDVVPLTLADGRTIRTAPLICYDALEPRLAAAAVRRGAELIVTLSNDSWFAFGPGPRLHLIGAAFRSIETRRPQLRATNTGISAVISPTGELVETAGVDARATLVGRVLPDGRTTTLVVRWGDWFGPTALAAGLAWLALSVRPRRAPRSAAPAPRIAAAGR